MVYITSCRQTAPNIAEVNGNLTDGSGVKLIMQEMDVRDIHSLDSVVLGQSGKFTFCPVVREPGFWLLRAPTGKILVMLLSPGEQLDLTGSILDFPDRVAMKGSEEAMLLNDFFRQTRANERLVDSLEMLIAEWQDRDDYYQLTQKLDTSFMQIWESQRSNEIRFIENNPGSLASLVVLNYGFGMSPVLSPEEDFTYYQKLDSTLSVKFPVNKHVKFHHQRVQELKRNISAPSVLHQTPRKKNG